MFIIGSIVILLIGSVIGFRLYKYYNYSGELIGLTHITGIIVPLLKRLVTIS